MASGPLLIVKNSLLLGYFPQAPKTAVIRTLFKKNNQDNSRQL